jgi:hypothetical protein
VIFVPHVSWKQEDQLYSDYHHSVRLSGHRPTSQDIAPIEESLIGGLKKVILSRKPPVVPPKDTRLPSSSTSSPPSRHETYTSAQLTSMSAVERSRILRVARMDPHLQVRAMLSYLTSLSAVHFDLLSSCAVLCSSMYLLCASLSSKPLMHNLPRYDTIDDYGTWHGAALIVSECRFNTLSSSNSTDVAMC